MQATPLAQCGRAAPLRIRPATVCKRDSDSAFSSSPSSQRRCVVTMGAAAATSSSARLSRRDADGHRQVVFGTGRNHVEGSRLLLNSRHSAFQISEERLHEFLQAEVSFFAQKESSSLTLKKVIDSSTPDTAAALAVQELPIRFAQRILQIEGLDGWRSSPELVEVHSLYSRSFKDLRLVELDVENLGPFTDVVQSLKGRMKGVIPALATAMRNLQSAEDYGEQHINNWLDTFLLSRIGTEMLTSQYIACTSSIKDSPKGRRGGIVDHACDPAIICDRAAKHVRKLCKSHYNMEQELEIIIETGASCEISGQGRVRFPYVPQYLFYILVELLKNSARATVESSGGDQSQIRARPIVVTVGADPSQVAIRVHDSAGGIPFSVADRVWSYMYSTANQSTGGTGFSQQGTPLAGFGVGLPLSRLYARYLGGSLHLLSLPGIGTRAYLYLKRLESEAREEVPSHIGHSVQPEPPL
mmetsp:Transcript_99083/g.261633  ORF Transcript_99083/g.261633 Transcript_99083/m.261633 type:complete len:471 (+) Transcript_99083:43-1455(+)